MLRRTVVLTLAGLGLASLAAAQTRPVMAPRTTTYDGIVAKSFSQVTFRTDPQPFATAPVAAKVASPDLNLHGRVQIGFFDRTDTAFLIGGGVTAQPFNNRNLEILVDGNLLRANGINALYVSGNVLYDFVLTNQNFTPYAGAGLGFIHNDLDTQTRLQILGGIRIPMQNQLAFFGELRIIFTEVVTATVVMGGIRF
jgi:hypothetical protein